MYIIPFITLDYIFELVSKRSLSNEYDEFVNQITMKILALICIVAEQLFEPTVYLRINSECLW